MSEHLIAWLDLNIKISTTKIISTDNFNNIYHFDLDMLLWINTSVFNCTWCSFSWTIFWSSAITLHKRFCSLSYSGDALQFAWDSNRVAAGGWLRKVIASWRLMHSWWTCAVKALLRSRFASFLLSLVSFSRYSVIFVCTSCFYSEMLSPLLHGVLHVVFW